MENLIGRTIYCALQITGAIICVVITITLIKLLYCNNANENTKEVMQPTVRMKICAISCGIVLFIGFIMKSLIISSVINDQVTQQVFIQVLWHLGHLMMDSGHALYFKYFIVSIRKLYRTNDNARNAILKPVLICTEVLIVISISISIIYTLCILSIFKSTKIDLNIKNIVATIYTISNLLVNLCIDMGLIYCLKAIIHNYAINWRFSDSGLINNKNHLLLLLMTRYCSLIIISASIDVITTAIRLLIIFVGNDYFQKQQEIWTILNGAFGFIN
eukprot:112974_1